MKNDQNALNPVVITNDTLKNYVQRVSRYIDDEDPQHFETKTILRDLVFFLGLSIDPVKYSQASGYAEFAKKYKAQISL